MKCCLAGSSGTHQAPVRIGWPWRSFQKVPLALVMGNRDSALAFLWKVATYLQRPRERKQLRDVCVLELVAVHLAETLSLPSAQKWKYTEPMQGEVTKILGKSFICRHP